MHCRKTCDEYPDLKLHVHRITLHWFALATSPNSPQFAHSEMVGSICDRAKIIANQLAKSNPVIMPFRYWCRAMTAVGVVPTIEAFASHPKCETTLGTWLDLTQPTYYCSVR